MYHLESYSFSDVCKRRTKDGLVDLTRPLVIQQYNRYMGGVDLADMRRLHCNSTIMGQNRWWLKLFFYLLDVGTSNALVLFKCAKPDAKGMSIVSFKEKLVEAFMGARLEPVPQPVVPHVPKNSERRLWIPPTTPSLF